MISQSYFTAKEGGTIVTKGLLILTLHCTVASSQMDQRNSTFQQLWSYQLGEDTARGALYPPRYDIQCKSMTILGCYVPSTWNTQAQDTKMILELTLIISIDPFGEFMLSIFTALSIVGLEVLDPREGLFPPEDTERVILNFELWLPLGSFVLLRCGLSPRWSVSWGDVEGTAKGETVLGHQRPSCSWHLREWVTPSWRWARVSTTTIPAVCSLHGLDTYFLCENFIPTGNDSLRILVGFFSWEKLQAISEQITLLILQLVLSYDRYSSSHSLLQTHYSLPNSLKGPAPLPPSRCPFQEQAPVCVCISSNECVLPRNLSVNTSIPLCLRKALKTLW